MSSEQKISHLRLQAIDAFKRGDFSQMHKFDAQAQTVKTRAQQEFFKNGTRRFLAAMNRAK